MKKITHRLICMMLVSCMLFNSMTSIAFAFDREASVSFEELTPETLDVETLNLLGSQNMDQSDLLVESNSLSQVNCNYDSPHRSFNVTNVPTDTSVMLAGYSCGQMTFSFVKDTHKGAIQWTLPKNISFDTVKAFILDEDHAPVCDAKEYYATASVSDDLFVADFYIDRDHVMTGETITITAAANRFANNLTYHAAVYLENKKVDQIVGSGKLTYVPNEAGVYTFAIEVVDNYGKSHFSYFEDALTVVPYWSASGISINSNSLSVGEKITFSITNENNLNNTSISFSIFKDGSLYREIDDAKKSTYTLATTEPGTYYCKVNVVDNHGNHAVLTSENVKVTRKEYCTEVYNSPTYTGKINVSDVVDKRLREVRVAVEDLTISWDRQTDDSYYTVEITSDATNFETIYIKNYKQNNYTIPSGDLYPGYEYEFEVIRYNSAGKRLSYSDFDFVVFGGESILLESSLDVIVPSNYMSVNYDDFVVQWTKMAYAKTIEITLEYRCGADKHKVSLDTVPGDTSMYTIAKEYLQYGKLHEVEIIAKDHLGNESSDDKYFYVGCEGDSDLFEIEEPVLTSEFLTDGYYRDKIPTYPVYEPIEITWEDNPAASYFSLHVTDSETKEELVFDNITENSFSIPPTALNSGNRYYVKVSAHHTADCYDTSDRLWFRAPYPGNLTLDPPVISSPELTQEIDSIYSFVKQDLTITWKPVSAAVTYGVEVYETEDRDWVDFETTGLTAPSVTIPKDALITGVPYAILIYAYDAKGNYTYEKYYLQMVSSSIAPPVLLSPVLPTDEEAALPTMSEDDLVLVWGSVDGAVKYRVKLWEFWSDDWDDIFTAEDITQTTCTIPEDELYEGGLFKVRITAYDQFGNTRVSSPYYFQIGDSGYLELSKESFNFDYKADKETLKITSSSAWTAQPSASWITLNNTYGDASMTLTVNVDENTGDFPRSGSITFTNSAGGYAVFAVTQNGNGSSNSGSLEITSPEQGDTIDYAKFRAAWKWKYDFAYFKVTLTDVTSGRIVHSEDCITSRYTDIPLSALAYGHTYQLVVAVYNTQHAQLTTATIVFRTEDNSSGSGAGADAPDDNDTIFVTSISIKPQELSLILDDTYALSTHVLPVNATQQNVSWQSSNTNVATVDAAGVVTAKAVGSATIIASATDGSGKSAVCPVTVSAKSAASVSKPSISDYSLEPATVVKGETFKLKGILSGNGEIIEKVTVAAFPANHHDIDGVQVYSCAPKTKTYDLSNVPAIKTGYVYEDTNGNSMELAAGQDYDILIYASLSNGEYFRNDSNPLQTVTVTAPTVNDPFLKVYGVDNTDLNGKTLTFAYNKFIGKTIYVLSNMDIMPWSNNEKAFYITETARTYTDEGILYELTVNGSQNPYADVRTGELRFYENGKVGKESPWAKILIKQNGNPNVPIIESVSLVDNGLHYNKNNPLTLTVGDHNYQSGYDLQVDLKQGLSTNWYIYVADKRVANVYSKNGKYFINALSEGSTKIYISGSYASSYGELKENDLTYVCNLKVKSKYHRKAILFGTNMGIMTESGVDAGASSCLAMKEHFLEYNTTDVISSTQGNKYRLFQMINSYAEDGSDDDITFVFSATHGAKDKIAIWTGGFEADGSTVDELVTYKELFEEMAKIPGKIVYITIACFSGTAIKEAKKYGDKFTVLAASNELLTGKGTTDLYSTWFFSRGLILAISEGDVDNDGIVTVGEAFDCAYVYTEDTLSDSKKIDNIEDNVVLEKLTEMGVVKKIDFSQVKFQDPQFYGDRNIPLWVVK